MNKYLLYSHLQKTFQSLRKETREHLYLSFHRAYILSIESVRREKQQEKHFLRAQIAKQESKNELDEHDDRTVNIRPENTSYVSIEQ